MAKETDQSRSTQIRPCPPQETNVKRSPHREFHRQERKEMGNEKRRRKRRVENEGKTEGECKPREKQVRKKGAANGSQDRDHRLRKDDS